jgi:hypothetical protein
LHDVSKSSTTQYASSGFIDKAGGGLRPSWDYFFQTKQLLGDFRYETTLHTDPFVDKYVLDNRTMYVLVVPDEAGREEKFELNVGNSKQVRIHELVIGAKEMKTTTKEVVNGKLIVNATETPIFVEVL